MSDTITSQVQSAADHERLGEMRQRYHGRFRMSVIFLIVLAALFGVVIPVQSLLQSSTEIAAILIPLGLLFVAFTIWIWIWERRHSNDDLYLFDGGLVHVDRKAVVTSYPWQSITEVRARRIQAAVEDIPVRTVTFIKVVRGDGASVILNNRFRGVKALGNTLHASTANARLPLALDALRAGQTISFDGLVIDVQGIRHGGRTITWPTITSLAAAEGFISTKVTIHTTGRRRPYTRRLFPARPFPNYWLLVGIARAFNVD